MLNIQHMKYIFHFLFAALSLSVSAQYIRKPSPAVIETQPLWAQTMYSENPNVFVVDSLYKVWYSTHEFVKDYNTFYYKTWRREVASHLSPNGFVIPAEQIRLQPVAPAARSRSPWSMIGPEKMFDENATRIDHQTNVYCIAQSVQQPSILFCGTEPGDIFKSTDAGQNWTITSSAVGATGGFTSIVIDPTNVNVVYAGTGRSLLKTTDGGVTWSTLLTVNNLWVNEILINPLNNQQVMAACNAGLYKSMNGGATWTQVFTDPCYDLKYRPGNYAVLYLLKNNPAQLMCEFLRSTDGGQTFIVQSAGWYASADPARQDMGARLGVTPADSLRVYAYLIGESKPNDVGYIGLFKSTNGGTSWTNPNGQIGGPYSTQHPNLARGTPTWNYHQGFYNCALMVSNTDADKVLIGGLNLWRSDDGGVSYTSVAGYIGGPLTMHVDMQDFRATPTGYWITSDGGINHSTDFFVTDPVVMMDGIHGSEFWGFGTGWNEDVMVGGLYHNGTVAWYENYTSNDYLQLVGGEPASGYINPGQNRLAYSSGMGSAVIPASIGQPITYGSIGLWPNESYWGAESGKMEFDPRCYNTVYIGNDNKFWKSTDGGVNYSLLYTFGTTLTDEIIQTEIAWTNPNIIYACQHGGGGKLWKTTNGGTAWSQLTIPSAGPGGNRNWLLITLSPVDENKIWLGYPYGANGNKTFYSNNGGVTWTNITDSNLDNQSLRWLQHIGNTDGGIYCVTNQTVYYRNNSTATWQPANTGLPLFLDGLSAKPFYRDGKIKLSSYGHGVWETTLQDQPAGPVCQPQVNKMSYPLAMTCEADTLQFEDHSILNHAGASWQWNFPGGNPSTSSIRNPRVVYTAPGTYTVTLTVTDSAGQTDSNTLLITVSPFQALANLTEGFQSGVPPQQGWWLKALTPAIGEWQLNTSVGGYGNSTQSAMFNNYYTNVQGDATDMRVRVDMTQQQTSMLRFDVAYAQYNSTYSDTLEVLVSTDCGATFSTVYRKGGAQLGTAPQTTSIFTPDSSQWRTESVSLAAFAGETDLLIAFRDRCYYGQLLYLDNINLSEPLAVAQPQSTAAVSIYPNPAASGQAISLLAPQGDRVKVELFSGSGKLVHSGRYTSGETIQLPELAAGVYVCRISGETYIRHQQLIIN
jgi:PKD repeat protein/photosystem II stability/assembly factor-like uncharacterized protein